MKNVHILATLRASRFFKDDLGYYFSFEILQRSNFINQHIYITSNEEIKVGDWCLDLRDNSVFKIKLPLDEGGSGIIFRIILTTHQDLIADGVLSIDDEFLEWFVKNPSCEKVELGLEHYFDKNIDKSPFFPVRYKIIIPKEEPKCFDCQGIIENGICFCNREEPKQETLEEVAERLLRDHRDFEAEGDSSYQNGRLNGILEGLKYQSERMYSEEDVRDAFALGMDYYAEPNDWDKVTPKQKLENLLIKKQ